MGHASSENAEAFETLGLGHPLFEGLPLEQRMALSRDVARCPDDAFDPAPTVPFNHASSRRQPSPLEVRSGHAVFAIDAIALAVLKRFALLFHAVEVFGMKFAQPIVDAHHHVFGTFGRKRLHPDGALLDVPIPNAVVGGRHCGAKLLPRLFVAPPLMFGAGQRTGEKHQKGAGDRGDRPRKRKCNAWVGVKVGHQERQPHQRDRDREQPWQQGIQTMD